MHNFQPFFFKGDREIFTLTEKQPSSCFKQNFYFISLKVGTTMDLDYSFKRNMNTF